VNRLKDTLNPVPFRSRKLTLQTPAAGSVCTAATDRLFVTDKNSKRRFLIDTGSDLCVYPRKFIPQRRSRVNNDLYAANGNTIHTYGWLSLSLNLGLRREFTWRFVVADVTEPLIGADFLTHFGLLVDCRNSRLLDHVMSLFTPAQATSPRIASIKVTNTGYRSTPYYPSSSTSFVPLAFSGTCDTILSTTFELHQAHQSPADHVDWRLTDSKLPRPS
jgi:hypothetical protein